MLFSDLPLLSKNLQIEEIQMLDNLLDYGEAKLWYK